MTTASEKRVAPNQKDRPISSIALSAATRQNLLSLQDTAALTATTQNRLATGKTVNSALDDPLSFFTAQGLDNRSNDLNNLPNGVSNGVRVIQAANQGITSTQKLIDSAKSLANQALASKNYTMHRSRGPRPRRRDRTLTWPRRGLPDRS